jgi:tetratricopeptide (TPR) repeat protein
VQPLEPPDTHCLLHAVGWIELGNLTEAKAELAQVRPAFQGHPDMLEVRWQICAEEKQWEEGLRFARALIHAAPDRSSGWLHQAYALRRVRDGGLHQAWEALLPAFEKFPHTEIIAYNLSCYACQMHETDAARLWLKRALALGPKDRIKQRALADTDLEPLWGEIKQY